MTFFTYSSSVSYVCIYALLYQCFSLNFWIEKNQFSLKNGIYLYNEHLSFKMHVWQHTCAHMHARTHIYRNTPSCFQKEILLILSYLASMKCISIVHSLHYIALVLHNGPFDSSCTICNGPHWDSGRIVVTNSRI